MSWSAALDAVSARALAEHLLRPDGQEDVCFALWRRASGAARSSALIADPILPHAGERQVHGNASFNAAYFLRAAQIAHDRGAGLTLLHSHPDGRGWQGMSPDDIAAERGHAAQAEVLTGQPLVGVTMAGDGRMSARIWQRADRGGWQREPFESVRVVGDELKVTFDPLLRPPPASQRSQVRTVAAWGEEVQADLARLRIGIVGAGSVGSVIAEVLARCGVRDLVLLDFDSVLEHNLDRLFHASARDVRLARSKVDALSLRLPASATNPDFAADAHELSVVEPDGFAVAASCDVLFSCVDRPWPRHALNLLASAHLIPVIDGGIAARAVGGTLRRADWRAHLVAPGRRCLVCLGQYTVQDVSLEREGYLDDPQYIAGLPESHAAKRSENVMAFSIAVAALEVLQLLTAVVAPAGVADVGAQTYHFVGGVLDRDTRGCDDGCPFDDDLRGRGDLCGVDPTAAHAAAGQERDRRRRRRTRLVRGLDRVDRQLRRTL
jgi:hypothetical protein